MIAYTKIRGSFWRLTFLKEGIGVYKEKCLRDLFPDTMDSLKQTLYRAKGVSGLIVRECSEKACNTRSSAKKVISLNCKKYLSHCKGTDTWYLSGFLLHWVCNRVKKIVPSVPFSKLSCKTH